LQPIRGSSTIELSDFVLSQLGGALKGLGVWLGFAALIVIGVARAPLMQVFAILVPAALFALLLQVVAVPMFLTWRISRDKRTASWLIDETGILRTDALGKEDMLPWSNIAKFTTARRVFWLKLRPRGRQWLLRRDFTDADQERLRELAARMVPG
jgi:hypothetical protein